MAEEAGRRLAAAARADKGALVRRARADAAWVAAAIAERAEMLDEMERVELETGGEEGEDEDDSDDVMADLDAWFAAEAAALADEGDGGGVGGEGNNYAEEHDADDDEDDDKDVVYVDAEGDVGGPEFEYDLRDELLARLVDEDDMQFHHELLEFTVPGAFVA